MVSLVLRNLLLILVWCCCLVPLQGRAAERLPYREVLLLQMFDWMDAGLWEEISEIPAQSILPIQLIGGETAYLAPGYFKRGRNGWLGTLLIRPAAKQVTDVSEWIKWDVARYDFDKNGVTEIFATTGASGGGSEYNTLRVLQFDGAAPRVLLEADYEDHSGHSDGLDYKHVDWRLYHLDGVTYVAEAKENRTNGKVKDTFTAYAFASDRFVKVKDKKITQQVKRLYALEGLPVSESTHDYDKFSHNPTLAHLAMAYNATSTKPVLPLDVEMNQYRAKRIAENPHFALEYAVHVVTQQLKETPWWPQGYAQRAELYAMMHRFGPAIEDLELFLAFDTDEASLKQAQTQKEIWKERLRQLPLPEMTVIPAGEFQMGTASCNALDCKDELPQHLVRVPSFELAVTVLTCEQWNSCVADGGCQGWQACGDRGLEFMVINQQLQQYFDWLNAKTGKRYRLPTEAEWEYAARAGTVSKYYWGDSVNASAMDMEFKSWVEEIKIPNVSGRDESPKPVRSYPPNPFGLYDMAGYIPQLTQDCYVENYADAPTDGSARITQECSGQVLRGGRAGEQIWDKHAAGRAPKPRGRLECGSFALRLARSLE